MKRKPGPLPGHRADSGRRGRNGRRFVQGRTDVQSRRSESPARDLHDGHGQSAGQRRRPFWTERLDEPERAGVIAQLAKDALKGVPSTLEIKALNERIDKILKAAPKTT